MAFRTTNEKLLERELATAISFSLSGLKLPAVSAKGPPPPENEEKVMDDLWASTPMDSALSFQAPKNLFATGELPKNANNNPFMYETWNDTNQVSGEVMYYIKIEDIDEDSPSFGKSFTYSI